VLTFFDNSAFQRRRAGDIVIPERWQRVAAIAVKKIDRFVLFGAPDLAAGLGYLSVRIARKNPSDPAWEERCSR
jgi:hypothetical protein